MDENEVADLEVAGGGVDAGVARRVDDGGRDEACERGIRADRDALAGGAGAVDAQRFVPGFAAAKQQRVAGGKLLLLGPGDGFPRRFRCGSVASVVAGWVQIKSRSRRQRGEQADEQDHGAKHGRSIQPAPHGLRSLTPGQSLPGRLEALHPTTPCRCDM
jgi:hypothetical protein